MLTVLFSIDIDTDADSSYIFGIDMDTDADSSYIFQHCCYILTVPIFCLPVIVCNVRRKKNPN